MKDGLVPVSDNAPWLDPSLEQEMFPRGVEYVFVCMCVGARRRTELRTHVSCPFPDSLPAPGDRCRNTQGGFYRVQDAARADVSKSQWNFSNCCYKLRFTEHLLCSDTMLNSLSCLTTSYDTWKISILSNLFFLYLLIINLM